MSKKYDVVWQGKQTGIYTNWEDCKQQVHGYTGASYKSFTSKEEAEQAFYQGENQTKSRSNQSKDYIADSISVDAACSGNPGEMEYQGVYTKSGEQLFHYGPVPKGTNNIGEFLAIVHALAYLQKKDSSLPIYSDSATAIAWVRNKRANTKLVTDSETMVLWNVIHRAEKWLHENQYSNKILRSEEHTSELQSRFDLVCRL